MIYLDISKYELFNGIEDQLDSMFQMFFKKETQSENQKQLWKSMW